MRCAALLRATGRVPPDEELLMPQSTLASRRAPGTARGLAPRCPRRSLRAPVAVRWDGRAAESSPRDEERSTLFSPALRAGRRLTRMLGSRDRSECEELLNEYQDRLASLDRELLLIRILMLLAFLAVLVLLWKQFEN